MSQDIRIKKGLDIKLKGEAEKVTKHVKPADVYTLKPEDFHSIIPKLSVKVGARVKSGDSVFFSKANPAIKFPSPVSGTIKEIIRGEKRKILAVEINADNDQTYTDFGKKDVQAMTGDDIKEHLLQSGCWPFIKQRPYDIVANPDTDPKSIFISAYASAPLAGDLNYTLKGKEAELQAALIALDKMTSGQVHITIGKDSESPFRGLNNAVLHTISGPHPAGNVSTQIARIDPVNKGEVVWVINPQDLVIIGELLLTGKFNAERIIALVGAGVKKPRYYSMKIGSSMNSILKRKLNSAENRVISGDVLTGSN
jgi:Na+-transporting NADH:ubiquinone oxidoreductase subunit A